MRMTQDATPAGVKVETGVRDGVPMVVLRIIDPYGTTLPIYIGGEVASELGRTLVAVAFDVIVAVAAKKAHRA